MPDDYLDGLAVDDRTAQWTRILTSELDPSRAVFVAADDGRIVGFIAVGGEMDVPDATRGQVYALNVDPDRWGRGVGRALVAAGCGHLRGVGFATAVCGCTGTMRGRVASTARRAGVPMPPSVAPTRSAS